MRRHRQEAGQHPCAGDRALSAPARALSGDRRGLRHPDGFRAAGRRARPADRQHGRDGDLLAQCGGGPRRRFRRTPRKRRAGTALRIHLEPHDAACAEGRPGDHLSATALSAGAQSRAARLGGGSLPRRRDLPHRVPAPAGQGLSFEPAAGALFDAEAPARDHAAGRGGRHPGLEPAYMGAEQCRLETHRRAAARVQAAGRPARVDEPRQAARLGGRGGKGGGVAMRLQSFASSSRATKGRPGIHSGTVQEWIPGLRFAPPGTTRTCWKEGTP